MGVLFGRRGAYSYLRDSAERFMTQDGLIRELGDAGFAPLHSVSLFGRGMVSLTVLEKK